MAETKYLDQTGLRRVLEGINTKFTKVGHKHTKADITDFAHTHDDRYYTESEINTKVNAINAAISGKAASSHTHDDRYYTESEINAKLAGKSDTSHSHTTHLTTEIAASTDLNTITTAGWYKCSASEDAATCTNCPTKVAFAMEVISNAGTTQIVYEYRNDGAQKIYTRNHYYGTWGAWKRIYTEANKPTPAEIGAAASSHTHTKAQITDFPTSMPASDVYAWAKAPTKPSYTKGEVGLGNVDNTADSAKSVKYATSAGSAGTATTANNVSGQSASSDSARHVWFSHADTETSRVYNNNFKYNPASNTLTTNITGNAASASSVAWGNVSGKPSTFAPSAHNHNDLYYQKSEVDSKLSGKAASSHKHAAADITSVNASAITGVIASANLPSYVDDVLEYSAKANFPATGEAGKIYVDTATNITYRWGGSAYVEISPSLALGETSSTAYRGDRGATAYTHSTSDTGKALSSGLYKITTSVRGHVTAGTAVTKADITGLGIPAQDTVYTHPTSSGNKHIPSGGSAGQFLKWSADGTAVWAADNNTWNALKGATATAAGSAGYVAAPAKGQQGYFLRGDATWAALTKSTVGLGNVDNTADANKSVKYATSAGSATNATNATKAATADSATKATQDSAGQQINTTYIKSLTVSGRTITITKGNNTTTTITTQDTTYAAMTNDEIDAAFTEVFGS